MIVTVFEVLKAIPVMRRLSAGVDRNGHKMKMGSKFSYRIYKLSGLIDKAMGPIIEERNKMHEEYGEDIPEEKTKELDEKLTKLGEQELEIDLGSNAIQITDLTEDIDLNPEEISTLSWLIRERS